ncbi:MAG: FkbM family methyltransferase, partial [Nitrososphaeraceae archaeon]|nr:FkbM family methyltransferase [Nitrososphaeraceae archaeon]
VRPGDVAIECGSHHGCTAILLANWVTNKGIVHAFEPGINNYKILKDNISLNNIENIIPLNEAVGDKNCVIKFAEFNNSSMGSKVATSNNEFSKNQANTYDIKQVSLDTLSIKPDFIKIDTQGYVYQPLLGAKTIIEEYKPNLALELDSRNVVNHYGDNFDKIFDLIDQDAYIYFIQFEDEEPEKIDLSNVLIEWEKRNKFEKEIHLFAKNIKK